MYHDSRSWNETFRKEAKYCEICDLIVRVGSSEVCLGKTFREIPGYLHWVSWFCLLTTIAADLHWKHLMKERGNAAQFCKETSDDFMLSIILHLLCLPDLNLVILGH